MTFFSKLMIYLTKCCCIYIPDDDITLPTTKTDTKDNTVPGREVLSSKVHPSSIEKYSPDTNITNICISPHSDNHFDQEFVVIED